MAEKRIEIVPNKESGGVILRVNDVPEAPDDVKFRVGYRYTNEWLGDDGYWRRSMTLIEPTQWKHNDTILELWVSADVHANIEPNQPIRVEVPSVDAGQVVLWPIIDEQASPDGASSDTELPQADASDTDAKNKTDAEAAALTPEKSGDDAPAPMQATPIDQALAETDVAVNKPAANGPTFINPTLVDGPPPAVGLGANDTVEFKPRLEEPRQEEPRQAEPIAPAPGLVAKPEAETPQDARESANVLDGDFKGLATTTVRGSNAIPNDEEPQARRRSITKRRGHPRRRFWGDDGDGVDRDGFGTGAQNGAAATPKRTNLSPNIGELSATADETVALRSAYRPEPSANRVLGAGRPGANGDGRPPSRPTAGASLGAAGERPSTAIVPAHHFNEMDDYGVDRDAGYGEPPRQGGRLWRTAAALLVGAGVGAGAIALQSGEASSFFGSGARQAERALGLEPGAISATDGAQTIATASTPQGEQIAALRKEIESLVTELNAARLETAAAAQNNAEPAPSGDDDALATQIASLETELAEAMAARDAAASEARRLNTALTQAETQREAVEAESATLTQTLAAMQSERDAAQTALDASVKERDAAQSQAGNFQFRIAELEAAATEAEAARADAVAAAAAADTARAQSEAALIESEAARARAEGALSEVQGANSQAANARASVESALAASQAEAAELRSALNEAQIAFASADEARRDAVAEAASATEQLVELNRTRESLASDRDAAKSTAEALATEAQQNAAALAEARTEQGRLTAALAEAESQLARTREAARRFEAERDETAGRASAAASEAQRLSASLSDAQAARERALREIETLRAEAASLQAGAADVAALQAENNRLRDAVATAQAAASANTASVTAEADFARAQDDLQRAQRDLERVVIERDRALAQLSSLQRRASETGSGLQQESALVAASVLERRPGSTEAVDVAFERANDFLPTRSIQRSKLKMRLVEGAPIMDAVRGELGLRYSKFDQLVDSLCISLPKQCE